MIRLPMLLSIAFLVLSQQSVFGQNISIKGLVQEAESGKTLPFATIGLPNYGIGTASNEVGQFELTLAEKHLSDSLKASCLGYKSKSLAIADLNDESFVIELTKQSIELRPVTITSLTAALILTNAIDKIAENNWSVPHETTGFYRYKSNDKSLPIQISEASFKIYNPGYATGKKGQLNLVQNRSVKDESLFQGLNVGLSPQAVLGMDILRDIDDQSFLNKKREKLYDFTLNGIKTYKDLEVYEIQFDQKNEVKKALYKGKILIETESFSFVSFDLSMSEKGRPYFKFGGATIRALMNMLNIEIDMKRRDFTISYQEFQDKWYLNEVTAFQDFEIIKEGKKNQMHFDVDGRLQYITTAIKTDGVSAYESAELIKQGKLIEHNKVNVDPAFWEGYNILPATLNYTEVAAEIEARNEIYRASLEEGKKK